MSKMNARNRVSALKRLSKPVSMAGAVRSQSTPTTNNSIQDARQLLGSRAQTSFDARQLLSRQSSNLAASASTQVMVRKNIGSLMETTTSASEKMVVVTGLRNMKLKDGKLIPSATGGPQQAERNKAVYAMGSSTFVTIRNQNNSNNTTSSGQSTEKISFTKTIANPSVRQDTTINRYQPVHADPSLSGHKVMIRFVNDQFQKAPKPASAAPVRSLSPPTYHRDPPPVIRRLHDASIQTVPSASSSRSPIRMSSHRRHTSTMMDHHERSNDDDNDDDDEDIESEDFYEPPVKRSTTTSRKPPAQVERQQPSLPPTTLSSSVKRTSSGVQVSSRVSSSASTMPKPAARAQPTSTPATILVTNLQSSVTEEDVVELFSQIGRITEITTLSPGCVQIIFAQREHGEQAVAKYHNRLLDGQFMYVSLQQPSSYSTTAKAVPPASSSTVPKSASSSSQQSTKEAGAPAASSSSSSSSTNNQPLKFNSTTSSSNKIVIDPAFIRQALFHPSNNTSNPVQFQVKL